MCHGNYKGQKGRGQVRAKQQYCASGRTKIRAPLLAHYEMLL